MRGRDIIRDTVNIRSAVEIKPINRSPSFHLKTINVPVRTIEHCSYYFFGIRLEVLFLIRSKYILTFYIQRDRQHVDVNNEKPSNTARMATQFVTATYII